MICFTPSHSMWDKIGKRMLYMQSTNGSFSSLYMLLNHCMLFYETTATKLLEAVKMKMRHGKMCCEEDTGGVHLRSA